MFENLNLICFVDSYYSLHLWNGNTVGQIDAFLSQFSLDEFPHLQTLTLSEIEPKHITKLVSILPQMFELRRFDSSYIPSEIVNVLSVSKVRAFSLGFLKYFLSKLNNNTGVIDPVFDDMKNFARNNKNSLTLPLLGQVIDKEYCQAKKHNNRFNVPLGTKFYRVRVKPWKPSASFLSN